MSDEERASLRRRYFERYGITPEECVSVEMRKEVTALRKEVSVLRDRLYDLRAIRDREEHGATLPLAVSARLEASSSTFKITPTPYPWRYTASPPHMERTMIEAICNRCSAVSLTRFHSKEYTDQNPLSIATMVGSPIISEAEYRYVILQCPTCTQVFWTRQAREPRLRSPF